MLNFQVSAHHNKVPNLKLVMNPEGKLHDWTDLPESELPDLQHFLVNSPSSDISNKSSSLIESGKVRCKPNDPLWFKHDSQPQQSHQESPKASSFVSSFRQVFDSRRGLFEKARQISDKTNPIKVQNIHNMPQPPIITIKSSPLPKQHIPPIARSGIVETRPTDPPSSPSVPRRASSRQVCAQYRKKLVDTNEQLEDRSRPPLRSFFGWWTNLNSSWSILKNQFQTVSYLAEPNLESLLTLFKIVNYFQVFPLWYHNLSI